jgi:hypothetical protein
MFLSPLESGVANSSKRLCDMQNNPTLMVDISSCRGHFGLGGDMRGGGCALCRVILAVNISYHSSTKNLL